MTNYLISSGYSENGGNIALNAPWEHQKSELRCLAIVTDKEHQGLKVLNGDLILGSNGTYTIAYPFETLGLPWAAYLWRETTQNGNPKYENGRIPVEAMLSKLSELSKKADETREFVKRAFMTPEDAEGKMFVPPLEVRKGRLLGFDNNGNPVTGDACPQIAELDEQRKVIEGLAKDARDRALEAANSVILAAGYATNALNSANNAGRSAVSAGNYATNAKNWHDKTASESATTLAKSELAAGRSELAERLARESAARAEQAMNEALLGLSDLNEKLCYVACAVGRAEKAVGTVESRAEEAKVELSEKAEQTKQEIGAFTDVYKKTETYSKAQIDGVDTGAEVVLKMNEIIAQLKDWEAITGETLPNEFWVEVFNAFVRWQENPTETKEWYTSSETESTNPHYLTPATKPIIDFNVVKASRAAVAVGSFNASTNVPVFLSNAIDVQSAFYLLRSMNSPVILPAATLLVQAFFGASAFNQLLSLPEAIDCRNMLQGAKSFNQPLSLPKATNCSYMLQGATAFNQQLSLPSATNVGYILKDATSFNQPVNFPLATTCGAMLQGATSFNSTVNAPNATSCNYILQNTPLFDKSVSLPKCSNAVNGFNKTAMSAENISATLDSLPTWADGASHVITFTGSPGAKALTQDSPSVAAAVAKGWTVEL